MGHLINPVSLRLKVNKVWKNKIISYNLNNEISYFSTQKNLNFFLERFFNLKIFLRNGLIYSHNSLLLNNNLLELNIYLYKTIIFSEKHKLLIFFKFIIKKFIKQIIVKFSLKLNNINNYFFNYQKIFLKKKLIKSKFLKNTFFLMYFLKKFRFFVFQKFFNLNLLKNILNLNINKASFLKKLISFFLRKRFWSFVINILKFYLKPYLLKPIKINIYVTSKLTIDIIRKYITIRLQQRFKVTQIIRPVIRDLQNNSEISGFKFSFSGRFSRREMATYEWFVEGAVPLNTLNAHIEYRQFRVLLKDGICGIKIWINRKSLVKSKNIRYLVNSNSIQLIY